MAENAPKIVTLEEIEKITSSPSFEDELIEAIKAGFLRIDDFQAAPIQTLGAAPLQPFATDSTAQTCVKSGYFPSDSTYTIKVASGGHPWMHNSGNMQVYSQATGKLQALLLDEGVLTELRTAAVGSLAVQLFKGTIQCLGMVGTGVQARYQLRLLQRVTSCRKLRVWGRSASKVQALIDELQGTWEEVEAVKDAEELLQSCDAIITTTSAREPVLRATGDSFNTRLIVCIGSDAPGKGELDQALIDAAHQLVADNPPQSRERGEFQQCKKTISPLKQVIQEGYIQGENTLVIFDSSGVALQDAVISQLVLKSL